MIAVRPDTPDDIPAVRRLTRLTREAFGHAGR